MQKKKKRGTRNCEFFLNQHKVNEQNFIEKFQTNLEIRKLYTVYIESII